MGPSTLTKCGRMYLDSIISLVVTFAGSPTHDPPNPLPPVHPRFASPKKTKLRSCQRESLVPQLRVNTPHWPLPT